MLLAAAAGFAIFAAGWALWRRSADEGAGPGLPVGSPAPSFGLAAATHTVPLEGILGRGNPALLVFSDAQCDACRALAAQIADWQRLYSDELTIAVVEDPEIADLYGAVGTPAAVLIGRDGAIASPVAAGSTRIETVVADAVGRLEPRTIRAQRGPVPPLRRRELLVRGAGVWAATSAVFALPLRATAGIRSKIRLRAEPCEDSFDCPEHVFMHCRDGRCVCDEGYTRCDPQEATDRKCFDLQTSKDHCGSCNHACTGANHDVCCEGVCGEFGQTRCDCAGAECSGEHDICAVDPDTGPFCFPCADFGWKRCGNECADPAVHRCCGGRLYRIADLPPGEWKCCGPARNRRLVNVKESERNCGGCDRRCPPDKFCFGGRCRTDCPQGLKKCGNTCIDRHGSDPRNCGGCGVKCSGPFDTGECCNGKCCDINGDTCCPAGCTNTSLDNDNCGACGNKCKPGEFCRFGVCTCPPGEAC